MSRYDDAWQETDSERQGVAQVYDRIARFYDLVTAPMEWMGGGRSRGRLMARARGRVLEVGVGTGTNLRHYPAGVDLTGVDLSSRMLDRARTRVDRLGLSVQLEQGDVEQLTFPDASFDTVTATCVFCSVGNPVQGLREVRRVTKPDGRVLLHEHVRPETRLLGNLFDLLTPLTRRLVGPSINRQTETNVRRAGLRITELRRRGIWREIVAVPEPSPSQ